MISNLIGLLDPTHLFYLLLCFLSFILLLLFTLFLYLHRLLNLYSTKIGEVFEWNKRFCRPITFQYSWLKGVKISVLDDFPREPRNNDTKMEEATKPPEARWMEDASLLFLNWINYCFVGALYLDFFGYWSVPILIILVWWLHVWSIFPRSS